MLFILFGESCTGKSTLVENLRERLHADVYIGKDYMRLAENEAEARRIFTQILEDSLKGKNVIWVISEKEEITMIPTGAVRILVTAELDQIKERFSQRVHGHLPAPVATMLERKHGCFDNEPHDFHIISGQTDLETILPQICADKARE